MIDADSVDTLYGCATWILTKRLAIQNAVIK